MGYTLQILPEVEEGAVICWNNAILTIRNKPLQTSTGAGPQEFPISMCLSEAESDRFSESKGNITAEGDRSLTTQNVNYILSNWQKSQQVISCIPFHLAGRQ